MWQLIFSDMLGKIMAQQKYWTGVPWEEACQNPCVEFEALVRCTTKIPWVRKHLFSHPSFPPESLLEWCGDDKKAWIKVSETTALEVIVPTLDDHRYRWDFRSLCRNPGLAPSVVREHFLPFLPREMVRMVLADSSLFRHPLFSLDDLSEPPFSLVNLHILSHHPHFDESWFEHIPSDRWPVLDWKHLSQHPNIQGSFIEKTFHTMPWSVKGLSHHPRLPVRLVLRYRYMKWDWDGVSTHMTLSDLCRFGKTLPVRYRFVSKNLHLRPWFVRENLDKRWDRVQLAVNPALRPCDAYEDPLLFPIWRWDHVFQNPSLDLATFEKVRAQLTFPGSFGLFKNHFTRDDRYVCLQAMRLQGFFRLVLMKRLTRKRVVFMKRAHDRVPLEVWRYLAVFV